MIDPQKLISLINIGCKNLFYSSFVVAPYSGHHNISIYRLEGKSSAVNRFEIPVEPVKVLHWFSNFWIFLEIKFIRLEIVQNRKRINQIQIYISLSIYQGEDSDSVKYQLFRAEWDDTSNPNENHSQPHWHVTSNQAIERTFEDYSVTFDNGDFISLLEQEKKKVFEVNKIHFAINGNWQNDESHVHKMGNEERVLKWLQGILLHIRTELE